MAAVYEKVVAASANICNIFFLALVHVKKVQFFWGFPTNADNWILVQSAYHHIITGWGPQCPRLFS